MVEGSSTTNYDQEKMSRTNFENLRVYKLAEELADEIWKIVHPGTLLLGTQSAGKS